MKQVIPNVFIIGAPKCGTSSMAAYLSEHPNVCMSTPKEPTYFSNDLWQNTKNIDDYAHYFSHLNENHKVICDATPIYLYSKVAIQNILKYQPSAKFIIMLRNPVDAAYSLFYEWQNRGAITNDNFESLWRKGYNVSGGLYNIYEWTCFGAQIKRLLNQVDSARIHVIYFDEMEESPKDIYEKVLEFLNLPFDGRKNFDAYNQSKISRSLLLSKILHYLYDIRRSLKVPKLGLGIFRLIEEYNLIASKRPPLDPIFLKEMQDCYRSDLNLLSTLLQRDFSYWIHDDLLKMNEKFHSQVHPTFFIVGAPKCGTTFLHEVLSYHPKICVSSEKEPSFFAKDLDHHKMSIDEYLEFFSHANKNTVCIGEASTNYFRSEVAIKNIIAFQPNAKIIVMIRNPVDAIQSLFYEQQTSGLTLSRKFPKDWKNKMMGGASYFKWFCFGEQLLKLYRIVDKERVHVIVYDDLVRDSGDVYRSVLSFLGLENDFQNDFRPRNRSKIPRSNILSTFLYLVNFVTETFRIPRLKTGLLNRLVKLNTVDSIRTPLPDSMLKEIAEAYKTDINLLSDLLKRDFSCWHR